MAAALGHEVAGGTATIPATWRSVLNATVLVSALGYFVDIYDLLLFSIVRVASLQSLGVSPEAMLDTGVFLLNVQMAGLLVGGILWGVLGDKRGRVSVLFGSIALYSVANLANAFVQDVNTYAVLRFVAGVGLAGELGAAITLVSEVMPKETRGYGTAIVAGFGLLGAVAAALVAGLFPWRVSFAIGGALGLVLLVLRFRLRDSAMFAGLKRQDGVPRGSLLHLVREPRRAARYLWCILLGLPMWFAIGILVTFAPEFGVALGVTGAVSAGLAVLWCYAGGSVGDLASGWLSGRVKNRQWVMLAFVTGLAASTFAILFSRGLSPAGYYALCFVLGFFVGYWALFVTNAAEQFGTNLRATVTTTVPNLVRGSVVILTIALTALRPSLGLLGAATVVGACTFLIALWSLRSLPETYGKELDYVEA